MKNLFKLIRLIALVAVIGFSFAACDDGNGSGGNPSIDTTELNAAILEARDARDG